MGIPADSKIGKRRKMENLFNSPFMQKLQAFGQSLGSNKFLSALQAAMMGTMGVIMVGAISTILTNVLGPTMFNLFSADSIWYSTLYTPYQFTMNCLSLWVVALLGYNYGRNLKTKQPIITAINCLVCFLVATGTIGNLAVMEGGEVVGVGSAAIDMTYLGATGMFIGFVVCFLTVQIEKICIEKNIRIKMPDVVPPFLADGFASIIPLLLAVVLFQGLTSLITVVTGGAFNLASGFLAVLSYPLNALVSWPGVFVMMFVALLLWCFGIHGTMVMLSVLMPVMIQVAVENNALHEAGQPLIISPIVLFGALAVCGGTGNTLPLALMCAFKAKSEQLKAVGKISAVPGWFGINEPMTFGVPIMYNPIMCIPYVLNPMLVGVCYIIGYFSGFIMPAWISMNALLPMGFGNFLATLNWTNFIWDYLMLIPTTLVWYPFFKVYDKQLVAKEAAEAEEEAALELSAQNN